MNPIDKMRDELNILEESVKIASGRLNNCTCDYDDLLQQMKDLERKMKSTISLPRGTPEHLVKEHAEVFIQLSDAAYQVQEAKDLLEQAEENYDKAFARFREARKEACV